MRNQNPKQISDHGWADRNAKEYCIYKYVSLEDGSVLYIGKTDSSLKQRIDSHAKEEKFFPYLGNWEIFYFRLSNRVETDIVEKYLINQLKPVLNEKDMEEGLSLSGLKLPKWEPYSKYESERKKDGEEFMKRERIAKRNLSLYLDALDGLKNHGVFYSRTLHSNGKLPFMKGEIQITDKQVFTRETQNGFLYGQNLTEEAMKVLRDFPNLLEVSIYREIYMETDEFSGKFPYQNLWDFCEKMKMFQEEGYQEGEDEEKFMIRIEERDHEISSFFMEAFESYQKFSNYGYAELTERGCNMIPVFQERIAKLECMEYSKMDLLREEERNIYEMDGWDFGF